MFCQTTGGTMSRPGTPRTPLTPRAMTPRRTQQGQKFLKIKHVKARLLPTVDSMLGEVTPAEKVSAFLQYLFVSDPRQLRSTMGKSRRVLPKELFTGLVHTMPELQALTAPRTSKKSSAVVSDKALRRIFRSYVSVQAQSVVEEREPSLTLSEFYKFVRECRMLDHNLLYEDVMSTFFSQNSGPIKTDPRLSFNDFRGTLRTLARKKYPSTPSGQAFERLLREHVMAHANVLSPDAKFFSLLSGDDVLTVFDKHKCSLQHIFLQYSNLNHHFTQAPADGVTVREHYRALLSEISGAPLPTVAQSGLTQMASDFQIVPGLLSNLEFARLFHAINLADDTDGSISNLCFPEFLQIIGMCAFHAFESVKKNALQKYMKPNEETGRLLGLTRQLVCEMAVVDSPNLDDTSTRLTNTALSQPAACGSLLYTQSVGESTHPDFTANEVLSVPLAELACPFLRVLVVIASAAGHLYCLGACTVPLDPIKWEKHCANWYTLHSVDQEGTSEERGEVHLGLSIQVETPRRGSASASPRRHTSPLTERTQPLVPPPLLSRSPRDFPSSPRRQSFRGSATVAASCGTSASPADRRPSPGRDRDAMAATAPATQHSAVPDLPSPRSEHFSRVSQEPSTPPAPGTHSAGHTTPPSPRPGSQSPRRSSSPNVPRPERVTRHLPVVQADGQFSVQPGGSATSQQWQRSLPPPTEPLSRTAPAAAGTHTTDSPRRSVATASVVTQTHTAALSAVAPHTQATITPRLGTHTTAAASDDMFLDAGCQAGEVERTLTPQPYTSVAFDSHSSSSTNPFAFPTAAAPPATSTPRRQHVATPHLRTAEAGPPAAAEDRAPPPPQPSPAAFSPHRSLGTPAAAFAPQRSLGPATASPQRPLSASVDSGLAGGVTGVAVDGWFSPRAGRTMPSPRHFDTSPAAHTPRSLGGRPVARSASEFHFPPRGAGGVSDIKSCEDALQQLRFEARQMEHYLLSRQY